MITQLVSQALRGARHALQQPAKAGMSVLAAIAGVMLATAPVLAWAIPAPVAPRLEYFSGPTYTNLDVISVVAQFDSDVVNVDASDFVVTGTTATITAFSALSASRYQIEISGGNLAGLNGEVYFNLAAGQDIESSTGAPLTNLAPSYGDSPVTVNNTQPIGTFSSTSSGTVSGTFSMAVSFTPHEGNADDITGFAQSDFVVTNGTVTNLNHYTADRAVFDVTPTATGTVTVELPAGSYYDQASNPNLASTPFTIEADLDPPEVVSITRHDPATEYTNGSSLVWRVEFSKPVSGVSTDDFQVSGSTAAVFERSSEGADNDVWLVRVQGGNLSTATFAGEVGLGFSGSQNIADDEGRALIDTVPSGANETFQVSHVEPALRDILRHDPAGDRTNADSVTWDFAFSSISSLFDLGPDDFALSGTTATLAVERYSVGFYVTASGGDLADLDGNIQIFIDGSDHYDEYGNRLSSPNPTGSWHTNFQLDNTPPTVEFNPGRPSVPGGSFLVSIEISEDYDTFEAADIVVGNGSITSFSPYAQRRFIDIEVTPDGEGAVTIDVPAGTFNDLAGNPNTAAEQASVISDATPPTIASVEFVTTGGSPTNSDTLTWKITVSEPVLAFDQYDFFVPQIGGFPTVTNPEPTVYLVEVSGGPLPDYNGTVSLQQAGSFSIRDHSNLYMESGAVVGGGAAEWTVTIDNIAPEAGIVSSRSSVADEFPILITTTEATRAITAGDITVTNGTIDGLSTSGTQTTVQIVPTNVGEVLVQLLPGSVTDLAGNANTYTASLSVQYEVTPPSLVSIERFSPTTETTNEDQVAWLVTFSETVENVGPGSFVFSGADADLAVYPVRGGPGPGRGQAPRPSSSDSGETGTAFQVIAYNGDIPDHDGLVTLTVRGANTITDLAGLDLVGTTPTGANDNTFYLANDVTAPGVVISSDATDPVAGAFTVSVAFDEVVTGLELSEFVVTNGVASNLTGSGDSYTVLITPSADGDVVVELPQGAASDAAGNGNDAATPFTIGADFTAPTVTLASATGDTVAGPFGLVVSFSEPVTGLALGDFMVVNGEVSDLAGSGADYTLTVTPLFEGNVTIHLAVGAAIDAAGNASVAAETATVTNDLTGPTVVLSSDVTLPVTGSFTLTITFGEAVIGFELADLVATTASLSDLAGEGAVYTVLVTPQAGSLLTVDLAADVATDAVGNGNSAAEQFSLILDNTPPVPAFNLPGDTVEGAFTAGITFSEDVTGFDLSDIVAVNADLSEFTVVGAAEYSVLVTPQTIGTISLSIAADAATDAAENGNTAVTAEIEAISRAIEVSVDLGEEVTDPTDVSAEASISNPGSEPVAFRVEVDVPWLDVDPMSGTIPALGELDLTITVNALANELEAGTYTGTITVINLDGDAIAKGPNAVSHAAGDTIVVAIPLTVTIAERRGTIQLVSTTPGGVQRDATFGFASSDADLDGLSLTTENGYAETTPVRKLLGQYDVTQSLPQGWRLDTLSCVGDTDGGSVIDLAAGRVDIDLDANEDIVCTFANTRDEAEIRLATQRTIRNFMVRRADRILDAAPDLTRRLRDRGTRSPGQFSADINGGTRMMSMSTSLSGMRNHARDSAPQMDAAPGATHPRGEGVDVWLSARYSSLSDDRTGEGTDSAFGVLQLGADWSVGDGTLVGVLVQRDWMDEQTDDIAERAGGIRGARVGGTGWLAGPYVVHQLTDGVWFDAMALYGQSSNTVDPLGLYEDEFETSRYLLRMNLSGEWQSGAWRIRPSASLAHFEETQDAYVDSLAIDIPSQTIAIGRLEAGPEFAYRFAQADGGWWEPSLGLTGVWDYNPAELLNENGLLVGTGDVRLDARLGLQGQLAPGASIALEADVSGLGDGDFEARSARIELRLSFN
ncbi:hypothetical protein AWH62_13300 [Maricaulis sp. W15]|uniref:Ig-like domain-containing protein n=1 Tax=Maricaulis sp. W15 TaxID=1772333 RepID=UPI000948C4B9|nr:Ig-like domain-containing protein [Maricaulis sp. W15]OLF71036.1 hypothetical protein AWH62_13300 [Maricaulis sp. W15]